MTYSGKASYFLFNSCGIRSLVNSDSSHNIQGLQYYAQKIGLVASLESPRILAERVEGFRGVKNLSGLEVDRDDSIFISDSKIQKIFKVSGHGIPRIQARFFKVKKQDFSSDQFVYISLENRVERWTQSVVSNHSHAAEIYVLCEAVWSHRQALDIIQSFVNPDDSDWLAEEWDAEYPYPLSTLKCCDFSVEPLPCIGGFGKLPRQLNEPRGLAISESGDLYIADSKNDRVQVFGLKGLSLKAIWGRQIGLKEPWDVVINKNGNVWIADTGNHRLQKFDSSNKQFSIIDGAVLSATFFQVLYGPFARSRFVYIPARHRLERWPSALQPSPSSFDAVEVLNDTVVSEDSARQLILERINAVGSRDILTTWEAAYPGPLAAHPLPEAGFERPTHLATDQKGRVYVVDQAYPYVKVLNHQGRVLGQVTYASDIHSCFQPMAIALNHQGQLLLTIGDRVEKFTFDAEGSHYEGSLATWKGDCGGIATDNEGRTLAVGGSFGGLVELPPSQGYKTFGFFITKGLDSGIENCLWHKIEVEFSAPVGTSVTVWTYTAETELSADEIDALSHEDWRTGQTNGKDFLILSPPNRWLWLKVEFSGNGLETPLLEQLKVFFPRTTYLQYLPAVYQADPSSKDFLERFLSIFESTASSVEVKIDQIFRYFHADGVPDAFLTWLAGWVDMLFEPNWTPETRRALLRHAPELYRQRGTVAGLKAFLKLALGLEVQILEHYRLRKWLFLSSQSSLGEGSQLWGNSIVSRLQLEENSRIGDFALVGTGDPLRDPFHVYAHKFSVFIPTAQVRSGLAERQLNRLIDLEKPAYTSYQLCKIESRFRVGVQSTVGLDTLVGTYPRLVLNYCSTLGHDAVLSGDWERGTESMRVGDRSRVGVSAVVG